MKDETIDQELGFLSKKILELNKKLIESENAKSKFLSLIANELNNPMAVILGNIGHIKIVEEAQNKAHFELIYEEVLNLDFRIQNLMMAADIEAGTLQSAHERLDIQEIVDETIATLRFLIRNKEVHIRVTNRIDQKMISDSKFLFIILRNLLSNAVIYGNAKGVIELTLEIKENTLMIEVKNEGEGPSLEYKPQIFTRFAEAPKGETGLGIGLSIVRELSLSLEGGVDYDVCEECVVFRVTIPLNDLQEDSLACGSNEFFFDSFDDAIEL